MTRRSDPRVSPPVGRSEQGHRTQSNGLRGNLGVLALVFTVVAYNGPLIGLGGVIPVVISAGNGLAAPTTFVSLGLLIALFAVGLNAMAVRMTHAGAFYTYVTAGLGRPLGLSAGFIALIAYVTLPAGIYALLGSIAEHLLRNTFNISGGPPWWVWALTAWATVTALSLFNIELSAKVIGIASSLEVILVLIWNAVVVTNGGPSGRNVDILSSYFSGSFAFALIFGVLCLTGFESLQVFRSEVRDAYRTVPRATYISILVLTVLYAGSSYSYIIAFGPGAALSAGATDPTGSVLNSISQYVSSTAGDLANVLLLSSSFAACLSIQSVLARYIFALGRDRVLPAQLGVANPKHGSPMRAAAAGGALTLGAFAFPALSGSGPTLTFTSLNGTGAYCLLLLWLGTSLAVVAFFRSDRHGASIWAVLIAPIISALGLALIAVLGTIHYNDIIGQADHTLANSLLALLLAVVVTAFVLALWFRTRRPDIYQRVGNQSETVNT